MAPSILGVITSATLTSCIIATNYDETLYELGLEFTQQSSTLDTYKACIKSSYRNHTYDPSIALPQNISCNRRCILPVIQHQNWKTNSTEIKQKGRYKKMVHVHELRFFYTYFS